jgi:cyclopropane-fatty-acyl-phospholipid synthase
MTQTISANRASIRALKGVPPSFRIAGLALLGAKTGKISFRLPDGRTIVFDKEDGGPEAFVDVHDYAFAKRSVAGGDVGFAETYMDEMWSTPDLTAVLRYFADNFDSVGDGKLPRGGLAVRLANIVRHFLNRNSKSGSKRNISTHYDLGNEFYATWLDPSMTYSSALFPSPNTSLEHAQYAKYDAICTALGLSEGQSVLEIGCGWGGFAEYAARKYGATVTCLTISEAQAAYARNRMVEQNLQDKVEIRLEDYRDHQGLYDGVASIEMFEAVGESFWPSYFNKISEALRPGGKAALQIITIDDDLFESYRKRADFIQRYIFPGGMLPSPSALKQQFQSANLKHDSTVYFGEDYGRTVKYWMQSFNDAWEDIKPMGFDEQFRRMWNFYLSYCEAGFMGGRINVGQFALSKPG